MSGALEARKIPSSPDKVKANVKGIIEAPEGVLKITKISCHYVLKIPKGKREAAERALSVFDQACPVSQTLKGAIAFDHTWENYGILSFGKVSEPPLHLQMGVLLIAQKKYLASIQQNSHEKGNHL